MASLVQKPLKSNPAYREMTTDEFLELELEGRAELEDGTLYMMTGGTVVHAAVIANVTIALGSRLRGSACRVFGPDMLVRTSLSNIRSPDVSVYCNLTIDEGNQRAKLIGDPRVVVEVLSPSTRKFDQTTKLQEYQALPGLDAIVLIDPEERTVRLVERVAQGEWRDRALPSGSSIPIACLKIELGADEIFG